MSDMGHPTEKATNISGDNFSSGDPKTPSVVHHQQSASEPGRSSSPQHPNQKGILNRLPDYFRDTVDWFIGYACLCLFYPDAKIGNGI